MDSENLESELRKIIREIVKEECEKITEKDADNLIKSIREELHIAASDIVKEHLSQFAKYFLEKVGKEE